MNFTLILGLLLMCAAFISAAAEIVAQTVPGVGGQLISAYDLWYTFWPKSLVISRIVIERDAHALIWDPLLVTVLQLPAWLLLGGPGAAMAWYSRSPRPLDEEDEEDVEDAVNSIFLYDRLVEAAEKELGMERSPLELPYVPPDPTLVADTQEDDFDHPDAAQEPDDGPYEPGGDGDGRA